jgi:hypothetical protein
MFGDQHLLSKFKTIFFASLEKHLQMRRGGSRLGRSFVVDSSSFPVAFALLRMRPQTSNQPLPFRQAQGPELAEGQLTAGRSEASHKIMKILQLQSTLAPASGG